MMSIVGEYNVPYILMHNRAKSAVMTQHTTYDDLIFQINQYFFEQEWKARQAGIIDVILDPGIGFSKTTDQNFIIINRLDELDLVGRPLLIGLSRKSFIYKTLNVDSDDALNGSTAMHMGALERGAKFLRVHDVKEAMQCVQLFNKMTASK